MTAFDTGARLTQDKLVPPEKLVTAICSIRMIENGFVSEVDREVGPPPSQLGGSGHSHFARAMNS